MMNDDAHRHTTPYLAETLSGADRSSAARRGGPLVVIIATFIVTLFGSAESCCAAPPLIAEQRIEDPGGRALKHFYESLRLTRAARGNAADSIKLTRIAHYGDSHVAADILTGALRRAFARDFGDAGPGFLLAGKAYAWSHRDGVMLETSAGWRTNGLGALTADGAFGLAGISFSANHGGELLRLTTQANRFTLYLLKQPGGGEVEIRLDGAVNVACASLDLNGVIDEQPNDLITEDGQTLYVEAYAPGTGPHTLELHTLNTRPVRVLGTAAERDEPGVIYDAFGINGARATRPLAWDWDVMASNLARRSPDLIVVAYGSNEVGDADLNLDEYERQFAELLRRFHEAAPEASLLVIAPPDRAALDRTRRRWQSLRAMPALVAAQRRAAMNEGAAFWNLYRAMGGAGSIARWAARAEPMAQHDRVHLTAAGYRLVAEVLYAELRRDFKEREK